MPDPISWNLALPYLAAALVFGYLIGSIPFGLLLTKFAGTEDIRTIGSGNIGATNVLRTGRKGLAAATLIGDALKGTAAVLLAARFGPDQAVVAGLGAFLGHLFPVWLKFKGGKGIATYIGILAAFEWPVMLVFAGVWLYCAAFARMSSFAGLSAALLTPVILWSIGAVQAAELFALLTVLVWIKHHANIRRMLGGEEPRIGQTSSAGGSANG